ncbi:MAG: PD-(D/E)XK nuclease family protein [Clostridia bacterium]|nr:PD-(D/E)XK nuclease family protein [Clostridia bacterium]
MNFILNAYTLSECMDIMAERVEHCENNGEKNIIFCEDRLTLIAERAITRRMGGTFLSSVTTFARFLNADERIISKQGSVMAISGIMARLHKEKKLKCFTSLSAIENSAKAAYETIAQLASSEVTPETLEESSLALENCVLRDKIDDLALIYREYSLFLSENGYLDESKYLALLPERIEKDSELKRSNVFFLCYTSFTAQAMKSVRAAVENAKNVIGIFCSGKEELYTNKARDTFRRVCAEYGEVKVFDLGTPIGGEAEILRKGLYDPDCLKGQATPTDKITLYEASDLWDEIEYIAVQIKKNLQQKGLRYRDFALLLPNANDYSLPVKRAFSEYGIPCFFDEKKSLKKHPVSAFLLNALEVVRERFSPASVQALAQNVFFGESDEYRNYLLKYANYRGGAQKDIKETDAFDLIKVESGKKRLEMATKNIKYKGHGREFCIAIQELLKDFDIENQLLSLAEQVEDVSMRGYLSQIFKALERVLAEAELLTADREMTVAEFEVVLSEGLDATELSLIPLKTDAVFVGDISSSRIEKVGILFVAGMTDAVPHNADDTALVSDKEIAKLAEVKTLIEPTVAEVNLRTRESVCLNLCSFTDKLYLSYPLSADGTAPTTSEVLRYVKGLFKAKEGSLFANKQFSDEDFAYACSAKLPAVRRRFIERDSYLSGKSDSREKALSIAEVLDKLGESETYERGWQVCIERGEELFFKDGKVSPTALESYFNCPFKNFLTQGLKVRDREETLVMAVDTGNFLHQILEKLSAEIDNLQTEAQAAEFAKGMAVELLKKPLYAAQAETESGKYSSECMIEESARVAVAVYRQIKCSKFKVEGIEKNIYTPEFSGKIDRMDGTDKFVRIIDYKTGEIKAEPVEYYTGRRIQIQLYMSAVQGERVPAGVYYFPASVSYKSEGEDEGRYRMLGYMNGDMEAIEAGDTTLSQGEKSEFFDASLVEKNRSNKVMDEKTFRRFLSYSNLVANGARAELKDGFVAPSPYNGVCEYCKFGGACGRNGERSPRQEKGVNERLIADVAKREEE